MTDYLYQSVYKKDLLDEQFPILKLSRSSKVGEIERIINVVKILRKFREDKSISKKEIINYYVSDQFSNETISAINRMANASLKENNHILFTDGNLKVWIEENESLKKDRLADLNKKIEQVRFEINRAQNMLNNPNFINKAPKEKIALEQEKLEKYKKQLGWVWKGGVIVIILNGKIIAEQRTVELKKEFDEITKLIGRQPVLSIIQVGDNPASSLYIKNKLKKAEEFRCCCDSL
nr:tetrahydrofolate dehydrogenase/cyclohydrolase catalytic domain-containing protein [Mycoplasmopsis bovis]